MDANTNTPVPLKISDGHRTSQTIIVGGCKVTMNYAEASNGASMKRIQDTLLSGYTEHKTLSLT